MVVQQLLLTFDELLLQPPLARGGQRDDVAPPISDDRMLTDITQSVRPLAERLYDIRHWSEFERGGHFAAMEVPDLLAEDIGAFFFALLK
ncbi:hypothetical protein SAMN04489731_11632 [Amycolatopsis regifaucium]|nr:hypothetical protein SAMN04489731_11632 [Amycolatopsis regifaucium]